jgi:tRNA threonylcarbamoyladenosine biosynthesis protein TsaB
MADTISIAIETSSRAGAVALGCGDKIIQTRTLGPSGKHASELLAQMDIMLKEANLVPRDIGEVYISVGPGSFTGLRVGITVARTMGQMIPGMKLVSVNTPLAIAENFLSDSWENLGVLLASKRTGVGCASVHGTLIRRNGDGNPAVVETVVASVGDVLGKFPLPILFTGEALQYVELEQTEGITIAESDTFYPRPEGVWKVGRRFAAEGKFTPFNQLLPVYSRKPEAVRLWEEKLQ